MNVATADLLARYSGNLPRYTSYPTATRFTDAVGAEDVAVWLRCLPPAKPVSLYFHVPFCDELCRFCGCNTSVVRSEPARRAYGQLLREELRRVAALMPQTDRLLPVSHIHFGGGTPTTLSVETLQAILVEAQKLFDLQPDIEQCVELDPRHFSEAMAKNLAAMGFTRGSLGVQDIDPTVQRACGRIQSFEQTETCVAALRRAGFRSVNIDLIYGLPLQTTYGARRTADRIASLRPDRLAVFGYAHVPWKQKRQGLIKDADLPDGAERLAQREIIDQTLRAHGYEAVGLDHYALPDDALAKAAREGSLRRNFQGYTTDGAETLLGFGASAISSFPQGYAQNIVSAAAYARELDASSALPVARGVTFSDDDLIRRRQIERIMCGASVDLADGSFQREQPALDALARDGLVFVDSGRLFITEAGRPFLRHIAAVFDRYLPNGDDTAPRYAQAI
ncbi:oxygen-independent coproporphyrinogen III oxidase [Acetobacter sp. DsW_063]|uniref:oxygen-independent coproporphyrinogen III oxidase n=1 Tax=Acetobacter sp. DsW_063 TaxID=1514894 RepID=UPI000A37EDBB|nr:oxygen-independent coproporphyrinogen III oxidase [Acetobacter sp. DsW_063]OUJ16114.1 coproporphyrinogen III oxidase [Acetobacter sp. DsW_063]